MGLRINSNISALRALRNLQLNDRNQATSLQRLSTGLRINSAADDPSGLVLSEQLRAEINGLKQASENSQNATGLLSVADNGLQNIQNLLTDLKNAVVFAQNTGGNSPDQISAEQDQVDNAISAIDRIAATTRYSKRQLLNGNSGFSTANTPDSHIQNLRIRRVTFPPGVDTQTFSVDTVSTAQQGRLDFGTITVSGTTVLRITGTLGTQDIAIGSNSGATAVRGAVNAAAGFTGIVAVTNGGGNNTVQFQTSDFGTDALVQVEVVQGTFDANGPGFKNSDRGANAVITVNDLTFQGVGFDFNVLLPSAQFEFSLDPSTTNANDNMQFQVRNTGLNFQLREQPNSQDRLQVGIESVMTSNLGFQATFDVVDQAQTQGGTFAIPPNPTNAQRTLGGFLSSLRTGAGNDLFQNPRNASFIVDRSIDQVSTLRGFLGAVIAHNLEPNNDNIQVELENLTAAESHIRDLDFAEETANFTKAQILFQAGTAVLASANLIPRTVLTLLQ